MLQLHAHIHNYTDFTKMEPSYTIVNANYTKITMHMGITVRSKE